MKKGLLRILFVFLGMNLVVQMFAQSEEGTFEWKSLEPLTEVTEDQWNEIKELYGSNLHCVGANCGLKTIGAWFLEEEETEYVVSKKNPKTIRFILVSEVVDKFDCAFCADSYGEEIRDNIFTSPYAYGINCTDGSGNNYLLTAARNVDGLLLVELGDRVIGDGAYEWSMTGMTSGGPFYFWDSNAGILTCLDLEKQTFSTIKTKLKNPLFYYGENFYTMGLERDLLAGNADSSGKVMPGTSYVLKDKKAKRSY